MQEYTFILTILDSLNSDLHYTTVNGVTSYMMTPQNREPVIRHLTELYRILCEIVDVVHHDGLVDLLNEIYRR